MTAAAPRPRRSGWTQWARGDGPGAGGAAGKWFRRAARRLARRGADRRAGGVRAGEAVSAQGPKEEWLDYERIFKILRDVKYNGFVSLVYEGWPHMDAMHAMPLGVRFLRGLMVRQAGT